jgi:hypothetical protein
MKNNIKILIIVSIIVSIIIVVYYIKDVNHQKELFKPQRVKKIAFCFLIYDKINNEKIWYEYLKGIDKTKYNIYIHFKKDDKLKYFEKYKLNETIDTCWGCVSIVLAQLLLLKEALKDPYNKHFIWLSQACIPIKSFNYIYYNLDIDKSYYNISPDNQIENKVDSLQKYIKKKNIKKAAMPSINNRKHAQLFVDNEDKISLWFNNIIPNQDEIICISLLYHLNLQYELVLTPNISADAIFFIGWVDVKNYKTFNKSILTKKTPNQYKYICQDELQYLLSSKSMFARKFEDNCKGLENLNKYLLI